jgi:hypothetical protein
MNRTCKRAGDSRRFTGRGIGIIDQFISSKSYALCEASTARARLAPEEK